jgi:uncharacterized protein YbjQ (UPF0145 family)
MRAAAARPVQGEADIVATGERATEQAVQPQERSDSSFANHALTRLWQNASDRETGAEAVVAIRARMQEERESKTKKRSRRSFFRRGRS